MYSKQHSQSLDLFPQVSHFILQVHICIQNNQRDFIMSLS